MSIFRRRLCLIVIVLAALASTALAAPCSSKYDALIVSLTQARLPESIHKRVFTKTANAMRIYGSGAPQSAARAASQLNAASSALAAATGVPDELVANVRTALAALTSCTSSPAATASVPVRVSIAGASGSKAAGAGVSILVDGEELAKTAADGTATIVSTVGRHTVVAQSAPDLQGASGVEIAASGNAAVEVAMKSGGDLSTPAELQIAEAPDGVLAKKTDAVTLQLADSGGAQIRLRTLDKVSVDSEQGIADVTSYFKLRGDGSVALGNAHGFNAAVLSWPDPIAIRLRGRDAGGTTYRGSTQFTLGRYTSEGQIVAPAGSNVSRGGILVALTHDATQLSFWARSTGNGVVDFPQLPYGSYLVSCNFVQGKTRYFGTGSFLLDADKKPFRLALIAVQTPQGAKGAPSLTAAASAPGSGRAAGTAQSPVTTHCYPDALGNCNAAPPAPIRDRVTMISFEIAKDGALRPTYVVQYDDWPNHLVPASDDELREAAAHDDARRYRSGKGYVAVRAYGIRNEVVFRALVPVVLFSAKPHLSKSGAPVLSWVEEPPPWTFSVMLPQEGVQRVEVDGWLPKTSAQFEIGALTRDAALLALPEVKR